MIFPPRILFLYLVQISEPRDNSLRVVLLEAGAQEEPSQTAGPVTGAVPVSPMSNVKAIEIVWDTYVCYTMLNESFATISGPRATRNLELAPSPPIENIVALDVASAMLRAPIQTWRLISLNHILLVTGKDEPRVARIDATPYLQSF